MKLIPSPTSCWTEYSVLLSSEAWPGNPGKKRSCPNATLGQETKAAIISTIPSQQHLHPSLRARAMSSPQNRLDQYHYQFSCSVVSDSLWPHKLQHVRLPCPSPNLGVHPNSCPSSPWCHPTISSSVSPVSSCPQSFPASGSFQMSQFFVSVGQVLEFSFSISPSNQYLGLISFRMDWLDLLTVQGTLRSLLQHHSSKASILQCSAFSTVQLSHPYVTSGKTMALTRQTFVGKVMSLLFDMLSRLVITFLPRSKYLLISWLQSPSSVILESPEIKSVTVSIVYPSICYEVMGSDAMILVFWMLSFSPAFSHFSFTFIKRLFSSSLSAIMLVSSAHLRLLIFLLAILIPACASSNSFFDS